MAITHNEGQRGINQPFPNVTKDPCSFDQKWKLEIGRFCICLGVIENSRQTLGSLEMTQCSDSMVTRRENTFL